MHALAPEASLGHPPLVEFAPDRARPATPLRGARFLERVGIQCCAKVVLDSPMDLQRGRRAYHREEVDVLPPQIQDCPVVGASKVGHLNAGSPRKAGARVERRIPTRACHARTIRLEMSGPCCSLRRSCGRIQLHPEDAEDPPRDWVPKRQSGRRQSAEEQESRSAADR